MGIGQRSTQFLNIVREMLLKTMRNTTIHLF